MGRFQRANVIRPIADHEGHVAERSQDLLVGLFCSRSTCTFLIFSSLFLSIVIILAVVVIIIIVVAFVFHKIC